MKGKIAIILIAFMSIFICSCGKLSEIEPLQSSIINEAISDSSIETEPEEAETTYSISYYAIEEGKVVAINPLLYQENGSYPTSYTAGEEVYISPLKAGWVDISVREDREFKGWYADANCSVLYSGKTETEVEDPEWFETGAGVRKETTYGGFWIKTQGDLVFYAKLSCGEWTKAY